MGYHLNRLNEPVLIEVSKPLLTEIGIHHRLESCDEACKLQEGTEETPSQPRRKFVGKKMQKWQKGKLG